MAIEGIRALEGTLVQEGILGRERCIRQLALSAGRNVKFLFNPRATGLFFAGTVMLKERDSNLVVS